MSGRTREEALDKAAAKFNVAKEKIELAQGELVGGVSGCGLWKEAMLV